MSKPGGAKGTTLRGGKDGLQIVRSRGKRWTDAAEAAFLDHLGASCNITASAAASGFSKTTVYNRRQRDPRFAERWQASVAQGYARLELLLVEGANDALSGKPPNPDSPFAEMTVRDALAILQLHRASVKADGARHAGWRARPRSLDEVRDSILTKLAAFAAARDKS